MALLLCSYAMNVCEALQWSRRVLQPVLGLGEPSCSRGWLHGDKVTLEARSAIRVERSNGMQVTPSSAFEGSASGTHMDATTSSDALGTQPPPASLDAGTAASHNSPPVPTLEESGSLRTGRLTASPGKPRSNPLFLAYQYLSWDHVSSGVSDIDSSSNSNLNSPSKIPPSKDYTSSLSSSVASNGNSNWEVRVAAQKESRAMPAQSWMQELRGHFRRGGASLWGSEIESALSEGWKGFSDITSRPECEIDWWLTATAMLALCCALGIVSWSVLRLQ